MQTQIRQRAHALCEYCHTAEQWQYVPFTVDHIIPLAHGGTTTLDNLALACFHCNRRKSTHRTGSDPQTRQDAQAKPSGGRMVEVWLLGLVAATVFAYALPAALGESALWSGLAALGVVTAGLALAATVSRVSEWQSEPWTVSDASASVATEAETVNAPADEVEASEPVEAVTTV